MVSAREPVQRETMVKTSQRLDTRLEHNYTFVTFYCQRQLKKLKKQEMRALTKTTEGGVRIKTEFMVLQLAYFVS